MLLTNIFIFLFGASLGSFLNVVVGRLHSGESIVHGRSHCPYCKKTLRWYELIPLLSFIVQLKKCRRCGKKISWQYFLMEIAVGLILLLGWFALNNSGLIIKNWLWYGSAIMWLYFTAVLVIVFLYDLKYFLIPDIVIFPAMIIMFFWNIILFAFGDQVLWNNLLSAILPAMFFLALIIISRGRWMGMGDVKLVFLLGLFLGFPKIIISLFLAFTLGSIVGLGLILFKKYSLKSPIPFGTFLAFGSLVALFYGNMIIDWYLQITGLGYIW